MTIPIPLLDATDQGNLACLQGLTPENLECIHRLIKAEKAESYSHVAKQRQAAVAAILFQDDDDDQHLNVVMTTRALHLRSHPGQASLPGGKMEQEDQDVRVTALRESVEEVGLPADQVIWLHTGTPFLSKMGLLVHPVVFFLQGGTKAVSSLQASPSEVSEIWTTRLECFLSSQPPSDLVPFLNDPTTLDLHRSPQYVFRTYTDLPWLGGIYRLHRFRSTKQLIKGLTADVLIAAATTTFARQPKFQVNAPEQNSWKHMVDLVIQRYNSSEKPQMRWGDGESGDIQGSSEKYPTMIGQDDS